MAELLLNMVNQQQPHCNHPAQQSLCSQYPQQQINSPYFVFNSQQPIGQVPPGASSGLYIAPPAPAWPNVMGQALHSATDGSEANEAKVSNTTANTVSVLPLSLWLPPNFPAADSTPSLNSSASAIQFPSSSLGYPVTQLPSGTSMQPFENQGYVYPMPLPGGPSINAEPTLMVVPPQPREDCVYFMPNAASLPVPGLPAAPVPMGLNASLSGTLSSSASTVQRLPQYPYPPPPPPAPRPPERVGSACPMAPPDPKLAALLAEVQPPCGDPAELPPRVGESQTPAPGPYHESPAVKANRQRTPKKEAHVSSFRKDGHKSGNHNQGTAQHSTSNERRGGLSYEEDPSPIDITKNQLIVNFLPQCVRSEELFTLFSRFGEQHKSGTKVIVDRTTSRSKGYGFVYFKDGQSTDLAIKTMNGYDLHGRRIKVRYADQQRDACDSALCSDKSEEETSGVGECGGVTNLGDTHSVEENTFTEASTCAGMSHISSLNDVILPSTNKSNP